MNDSEVGRKRGIECPPRRRRAVGRTAVAVVLTVGVLGAAACSASPGSSGDPAASLQTVRYTYPGAVAITTPELLMQSDPAMCAPFGIKPEITVLSPGAASPAVAAGKIDATRGAPTSFLLTEVESPGAAKVVANVTGGQPNKFWGAKDVHTVADLRGKTVAATSMGATTDISARQALSEAGLTPGKDVQITYSNTASARFGLAASGAIQGLVQPAPLPATLTEAGWHELLDFNDDPQTAPLFATVISVNTKFIQDHPDAIKGLLQCEAAATKAINADPKKAADLLATATRTDTAAAAAQVAALQPFGVAKFPAQDMTLLANVLQKNNVKDFSHTDVSKTVDSSFVP